MSQQHNLSTTANPTPRVPTPPEMSRFVHDNAVDYLVKEHHRSSGEIYTVTHMHTNAKTFMVQGRKPIRVSLASAGMQFNHTLPRELYDLQHQLLYRRRQNKGATVQLLYAATDTAVVTFRRKAFFPGFGMCTILLWWGEREGAHHVEVTGNTCRIDYHFELRDVASGRIVARVRRKGIDGTRQVNDWTSYVLRVEAHQNTPLMALLSIALLEEYRGDL